MAYRRFGILLAVRVLLLTACIALAVWLLMAQRLVLSATLATLVAIGLVVEMTRYIQRGNRLMTRFLTALTYNDFSQRPSYPAKGTPWEELYQVCDTIMQKMEQLQAAREEKHIFLQVLTEQAGVGLMTFDEEGNISLYNAEAKRIFGLPYIHNVHALDRLSNMLGQRLMALGPGEKTLVKLVPGDAILQLAVRAAHFRSGRQRFTLLSFQHIGAELEEQEIMAWQKLISVLTHEVMNSITPIISLAGTARYLLEGYAAEQKEDIYSPLPDLEAALETIENRSRGMLGFVNAYRKLSKVPAPEMQEVKINQLFAHVEQLLSAQLKDKGIGFMVSVDTAGLNLYADPDLLEQVIINLCLNAMDAVAGRPAPAMRLEAYTNEESAMIFIRVSDNGPGVPEDITDKIFVPFFSTKAQGSGIGLSLCKQIMLAHGGDIYYLREPDMSQFILRFRKLDA